VINIDTPNSKDIVTMTFRSLDWPCGKPDSLFGEFVHRATFPCLLDFPQPDEQSTDWKRGMYSMAFEYACFKARTVANTIAAAAEQAGLVFVPRQPSPRMADAMRQLLQTKPGAPFEEVWAVAALAAAADQEIWPPAFAAATAPASKLSGFLSGSAGQGDAEI
jgi:hypothetical protein